MRLPRTAIIALLFTTSISASNHMQLSTALNCADALTQLEASGTPAPATNLPLSHFGVGIGAEIKNGGPDRVSDATIVNGKVTVVADQSTTAGAILETHALAFPVISKFAVASSDGRIFVNDVQPCAAAGTFPIVAMGPFAALRVGENQIVQSFGAGWMFGFRMKESDQSLNVGLAYMFQPQVKTLASGFADGQAPPTGETTVRFRTRSGRAIALVLSFGW